MVGFIVIDLSKLPAKELQKVVSKEIRGSDLFQQLAGVLPHGRVEVEYVKGRLKFVRLHMDDMVTESAADPI